MFPASVVESENVSYDPAAPKISIGITCFNAEDTIERAVLSAVAQDWSNTEIIVVDDASTDRSIDRLRELAEHYPGRIKVIRHENNKGYPGALNTIVQTARGHFIAFFDDDDSSMPERLSVQWNRLVAYEQLQGADSVFCYSNRAVVPFGADTPQEMTLAIGRSAPEPHGGMVADFIFCQLSPPPFVWGQFGSCTLMVRRSTLLRLGPFDETFRRCAEWDMAIRLAFQDGHFIAVDKPLVTQHLTRGAEKSGRAPLRHALALRHKYKKYLHAERLYWASLAQAHARFHYAKGERWKCRSFTVAACLAAPKKLLPDLLARRFA